MIKEKKELLDIDEVVKITRSILKYWYVLLFVPLIATLGAFVYTHKLQRNYAVSSQLLLKSSDVYNYQSDLLSGLNGGYSPYKSFEETANQIRVLKSNSLIQNVIDRLDVKVSYFIDGRLKSTELYKQSPFRIESPNLDKTVSNVLFHLNFLEDGTFKLSYDLLGQDKIVTARFGELITVDALYFSVQPNRSNDFDFNSLKEIDYSFIINSSSGLLNRFKANLSASNLEYSTVVELSLNDNIVERAKDFLDTLANQYIEYTLFNERRVNENTLYYIDLQLAKVVENISGIEKELELFKDEKAILDLSKEQEIQFEQLVARDTELERSKLMLKSVAELESFMLNNKDELMFPPSGFFIEDDEFLKRKFEEWYNGKLEILSDQSELKAGNINLKEKERRVQELFETLLQYVASTKEEIQKRITSLEREIASIESGLRQIPVNEKELLGISRKLAGYESLYSMLVARRAETEIAKAAIIPETKIIERAHPNGKIEPDINKIRGNVIFISFLLALGFVVFRVMFFETLKSGLELSKVTVISVLGEVPNLNLQKQESELIQENDRGQFANAFRLLRANMQFFNERTSKGGKVIMVTSMLPGEGKTFISSNLATITAMSGSKVVVVDLDLHKPRLHKVFGKENQNGVSSYIIGEQSVGQVVSIMRENLSIITAGPMPPNPSELVFRPELKELLTYLRNNFDFIFLDTPPVGPISDSLVLSEMADLNFFVLNSKYATKRNIGYFNQLMERNPVKNASIIMNGVAFAKGANYGKYGYGSYYGAKYYQYGDE